jgi:hypothetical protein
MTAKVDGQQTATALQSELTGGSARRWIFQSMDLFMGSSNRCVRGETYTFSADHTVLISTCVSGTVENKRLAWKLLPPSDGETVLSIGATNYSVRFRSSTTQEYMRLRTVVPQGQPIVDREFHFDKPEI